MPMKITAHRGLEQIGGCITEISTDTSRIFIDFGQNLPGCGEPTTPEEDAAMVALLVIKAFNMTTDYKVTELLCIIDEFCKHFDAENLLEDNSGVKRRRRAASLSDSEIMTILLYFHFGTFRNFKHYYLFFIKGTMKSYFPKTVSYNRFVDIGKLRVLSANVFP